MEKHLMVKLTEREIKSIVSAAASSADDYVNSTLVENRIKALEYYNGEPYGDEQEGKSRIVTRELNDAIEFAVPNIVDVFVSSDQTVVFEPKTEDDIPLAEQQTDYANYVFNSENAGFLILHTWIKDGLLSKLGVVKSYWEENEGWSVPEVYEGLPEDAWIDITKQDDVEVLEHTERTIPLEAEVDEGEDLPEIILHDITIRRKVSKNKIRIECIPQDEFLVSPDAKFDFETSGIAATFQGQKTRKTVSELIEAGFDPKKIKKLPDANYSYSEEEMARRGNSFNIMQQTFTDKSTREVWITEGYMKIDIDGDGVSELVRVFIGGERADGELLDYEEWDKIPYSAYSPILMPHVLHGLSYYDLNGDLQLIKSSIVRQMLNNLYATNVPRLIVKDNGNTNMDDVLNQKVGAPIRVGDVNDVKTLVIPFTAAASMPMIQYMDQMLENRTGASRNTMGLDPNALQNVSATAASLQETASQKKIGLIIRVFAETGLKHLFRNILHLSKKHEDQEKITRLRNKYISIDPSKWNLEMDLSVNVGLGTNNRDKKLIHLNNIANKQEQLMMKLGPDNPLVGLKEYHNTLKEMVANTGLTGGNRFFKDPGDQQQSQQPKPDPEAQKVQAELAIAREKMQGELEIQREKVKLEMALKKQELEMEIEFKKAEMLFEIQINENIRNPVR